eukprot:TRINITY_DN2926_c0_g1_i1.p1 TRINITY_DN2926_c0_g1~~TRINITY_DN2926_c0_g1_i1.p1  ORF type:complete len:348 (+),score=68.09 TRINITY_DN2926_c0_g1_i1:145-1188(+)
MSSMLEFFFPFLFFQITLTKYFTVPEVSVQLVVSGCDLFVAFSESFCLYDGVFSKSLLTLVQDTFAIDESATRVTAEGTQMGPVTQITEANQLQLGWTFGPQASPANVTFHLSLKALSAVTTSPLQPAADPRNNAYLTWLYLDNLPAAIDLVRVSVLVLNASSETPPQVDATARAKYLNNGSLLISYAPFTAAANTQQRVQLWFADAGLDCPRFAYSMPAVDPGSASTSCAAEPTKFAAVLGTVFGFIAVVGVPVGVLAVVRHRFCVRFRRRRRRAAQLRALHLALVADRGSEVNIDAVYVDLSWLRRRPAFLIRLKTAPPDPYNPSDVVVLRDVPPEIFRMIVKYL